METRPDDLTPSRAAELLDAAQDARTTLSDRASQPWWFWALVGGLLGCLVLTRLIPSDLYWLRAVALVALVSGMCVLVARRFASRGVATRLWAGPRWSVPTLLAVLAALSVAAVGFVDTLATPLVIGWAVAVALIYTAAGLAGQRAYRRYATEQR
ncbi:hypothetical protein [Cellulomonas sp. NPDC089187]|uniref:hypothetical protein n=1 Tax=Cellulomonas sp. NPDC089187 TaxID=3154970 RepID=UPI00341ECB25